VRYVFICLALIGVGVGLNIALRSDDIGTPLVDIADLEGAPLMLAEGELPPDPEPLEDPAEPEVVLEGGYLPDEIEERYEWLDFGFLSSFEYPEMVELDTDEDPPELPADILELDGTLIAIEGFMNPLAFDREGVSQFALVNDPLNCCFGATPQPNHWIDVTLPEGERTAFYSLDPVAAYGRIEVGELFEDGFLISLFRMRADYVLGDF